VNRSLHFSFSTSEDTSTPTLRNRFPAFRVEPLDFGNYFLLHATWSCTPMHRGRFPGDNFSVSRIGQESNRNLQKTNQLMDCGQRASARSADPIQLILQGREFKKKRKERRAIQRSSGKNFCAPRLCLNSPIHRMPAGVLERRERDNRGQGGYRDMQST
jgi:hypothetical protein